MKRKWKVSAVFLIAGLVTALLLSGRSEAEEKPVFKDQKEKVSYGIGVGVARDFKLRGVELDVDAFLKGLRDQLSGSELLISEKELDATMDGYARELRLKKEQADKMAAQENKKAGEALLSANAKKKGVITLPSGVQYKVVNAGKGEKPTETDAVRINYRGTLIDGTEIDSSYRKTEPAIIKVSGTVPGLKEAFKLMSPGAKWEIYIPSELAYGDRRVYQVGPNAALIFEVELLSVLKGSGSKESADGQAPSGNGIPLQQPGQKPAAGISTNADAVK